MNQNEKEKKKNETIELYWKVRTFQTNCDLDSETLTQMVFLIKSGIMWRDATRRHPIKILKWLTVTRLINFSQALWIIKPMVPAIGFGCPLNSNSCFKEDQTPRPCFHIGGFHWKFTNVSAVPPCILNEWVFSVKQHFVRNPHRIPPPRNLRYGQPLILTTTIAGSGLVRLVQLMIFWII